MGLFSPSEDKQQQRLIKKLEKYTKPLSEATDISKQNTGVFNFKRIDTEKSDNAFAKKVVQLVITLVVLVILFRITIGLIRGEFDVYGLIKDLFKKLF